MKNLTRKAQMMIAGGVVTLLLTVIAVGSISMSQSRGVNPWGNAKSIDLAGVNPWG